MVTTCIVFSSTESNPLVEKKVLLVVDFKSLAEYSCLQCYRRPVETQPKASRNSVKKGTQVVKPDTGKLWTITEVAKETSLHNSEVAGVLIGLGIRPRRAGSSLVISQEELKRVKQQVEASRRTQPA